jgi:hypothetical protein
VVRRLSLVSAVLVCALFATPVLPCSCFEQSEQQSLESSFAAFDAVVVKVRGTHFKSPGEEFEGFNPRGQIATLRVLKSLKGPHKEGDLLEFRTVTECCVCGTPVARGERWRVFVDRKQPYALHNCSGSYRLDPPDRN